jgi:hypothetical protein
MNKFKTIFKDVDFEEDVHKYYNRKTKEEYISCTTYISKFKNPFDPDGTILRRKADELGITPEELRGQWNNKAALSIERGNVWHKIMEDYIKTNKMPDPDKMSKYNFSGHFQMAKYTIDTHQNCHSEVMLYNEEKRLAGTADLLIVNSDDSISIKDYKTNAEIKANAYGKKLKYPLQHMDDHTLNHYTLQLNLYKYMLEAKGFKVRDMELYHLDPETGFINAIQIDDKQEEIHSILKYR